MFNQPEAGIFAKQYGFLETHEEPSIAKSDGANMLNINNLKNLLQDLSQVKEAINKIN